MSWCVLFHVTGINSATTTCQPRPANHDLCVSLAFEPIKNKSLMPQYASKWKDYKMVLFPLGDTLISFEHFYCYVIRKF